MREDLITRLRRADRLPSPSGVAIRILELVESEDTSIEDLSEVISSDPALTAKILKYINSPLMGLTFHGTTLLEAVSRIGMRGAHMLALSFSLISQKHRESCPGFEFDQFWSESLARAVAARSLAKHVNGVDGDEIFTAALLSRMGKLVLATTLSDDYGPVLAGEVDGGPSLDEREIEKFGASHLSISAELLCDWQLPPTVTNVVAEFAAGCSTPAAALLAVSDRIARFLVEKSNQDAAEVEAISSLAEKTLQVDPSKVADLLKEIAIDWSSYCQVLSVPAAIAPDFESIQREAEEQRTILQLANEIEVRTLREENEQLTHLAARDCLTGLLNRGAFDEELASALKRAACDGESLALFLVDVDHFKSINDTRGHQAGDAVLRRLAEVLNDNCRKRDTVFRYGGEEFAVIACNCSKSGAETLADGLRSAVQDASFVHDGDSIQVTVSVGVSWTCASGKPVETTDFLEYADKRLYEAKSQGRNTWCSEPVSKRADTQSGGLFSKVSRLFAS